MELFVVREEGGLFERLPLRRWLREIETVPIFGVKVGARRFIYDRILKRYRYRPFRIWPPIQR